MTLEQLRLKHPRLVYKRFYIEQAGGVLTISHEFLLEPDIVFRPRVTIPYNGKIDENMLAPYAFNLGMVEAISYWKAACPKEFVVEAGFLSQDHIRFWYDLTLHGLGEFFYRNKIDFTKEDFFHIVTSELGNESLSRPKLSLEDKAELFPREATPTPYTPASPAGRPHAIPSSGDLILVGGGKDSAMTLGILKQSDRTLQTMVLNPTKAALENIRVSGLSDPIIVKRTIDSKLLELNAAGYLNGHTPFSAYLAFLGITVAALYGNENVIVSNEKSANEGNVMYHGMEVNHQYSKSFRFETMFREYVREYLGGMGIPRLPSVARDNEDIDYFSFLRPLNDLQIGMMFTTFPEYFPTFRSCNVGSKTGVWCGSCAKCAFTYLSLSPFISREQLITIFGGDLFTRPEILEHIRATAGLTPVKPFECVGTRDEATLAVYLTVEKYFEESREVPEGLLKIKSDLQLTSADIARLQEAVIENWGDAYNLPPEHLSLLRSAWEQARNLRGPS
ncbi:MAG TPA: hypothetical protein VJB96_03050 [Patescibacteria group bacterium]|nr:hypothetical protein [Patescibacteria group bacterium]